VRRGGVEPGLALVFGYELDEPLPDHRVLSKARQRFRSKTYEQFSARIVQLLRAGLIEGDVLYVDSTLVKANASPQGLRSRALLGQKLQAPSEFVHQLSVVNDEPDMVADAKASRPAGEGTWSPGSWCTSTCR
jgi:hypothetical protein